MPQPTLNQVHTDKILTNISTAYIQNESRFIANKVFPMVSVDKKSDLYYTYTKNDWFRDEAQPRPPASESAGSGYNVATDSYNCNVFAIHKDVDNQVIANTDRPLDPFRDATAWVTQKMLLRQEIQWVTDFFATSIWGTDVTVANKWDDGASSDPIADIELGVETILSNTGFLPNTLVLGYQVFRHLKHHPDLQDRLKYDGKVVNSTINQSMLAQMFGVERVLVAMAVNATNVEGATEAYSFVHGKHALLMYVNPQPSILTPSAGYTFGWRGVSQGLGATIGISRFPMREIKSERVEAEKAWDNKVVGADLGYFLNAAVS
jgi:hypothetical protein